MDNSFTKKYFEYKYQYDFDILSKQELDVFLNIFSGNARFDLLEKRYNFPPSDYSLELQFFLQDIVKKLFIDWHRRNMYWDDQGFDCDDSYRVFTMLKVFTCLHSRKAYKDNLSGRKPEYVNGRVDCIWYPKCYSDEAIKNPARVMRLLDKENNYI